METVTQILGNQLELLFWPEPVSHPNRPRSGHGTPCPYMLAAHTDLQRPGGETPPLRVRSIIPAGHGVPCPYNAGLVRDGWFSSSAHFAGLSAMYCRIAVNSRPLRMMRSALPLPGRFRGTVSWKGPWLMTLLMASWVDCRKNTFKCPELIAFVSSFYWHQAAILKPLSLQQPPFSTRIYDHIYLPAQLPPN